jgi:hypothetical protein
MDMQLGGRNITFMCLTKRLVSCSYSKVKPVNIENYVVSFKNLLFKNFIIIVFFHGRENF